MITYGAYNKRKNNLVERLFQLKTNSYLNMIQYRKADMYHLDKSYAKGIRIPGHLVNKLATKYNVTINVIGSYRRSYNFQTLEHANAQLDDFERKLNLYELVLKSQTDKK